MSEAPSAPPHPRGLPSVLFIEDEEAFLVKTGFTEEAAALEMRAAFQQLQSMASNLRGKRTSLESKLPETSKALAMVAQLKTKRQKKETARVTYELIGGVYCAADVAPSDKVMLWLGANVMVEYSLDEAETFLSKQLSDATEALQTTKEDIAHLDDQINTLEVNINRMHNHAMAKRRSKPVGAVK
jgi:prefoldin alpha subunit